MNYKILLLLAVLLSSICQAQGKKDRKKAGYTSDNYEILCAGIGVEGTKFISVSGYSSNIDQAVISAKKNAIHGAIFKGSAPNGNDCNGFRPLASSPNDEKIHSDFYESFFQDGGDYLKFISLVNEGYNNQEVIKVNKRMYKVTIYVSVMYTRLREELEAAKVIKKLDHGF